MTTKKMVKDLEKFMKKYEFDLYNHIILLYDKYALNFIFDRILQQLKEELQ